jgi:putative oxidoreductase
MPNLLRHLPLIGRLLLALPFLFEAATKIAAPAATMAKIALVGLPFPPLAYGAAIAVELCGGLLLFAGLHLRWTGLVLAGFCLVTALTFHAHFDDPNQVIHFLKNLMIAGGLLQLTALGSVGWASNASVRSADVA